MLMTDTIQSNIDMSKYRAGRPPLAQPLRTRHGRRPALVDRLEQDHPTVHRSLADLPVEDVDLHGAPGIRL